MVVVSAASAPFTTVDRGYYSAFEGTLNQVYRTRGEFEALWQQHGSNDYPPPGLPNVDFSTRMVAVVFMGTQNSGGYDIEITSLDEKEDGGLVVNFMTSSPPPGAMLTMALTQPYHMVSFDYSDKDVTFEGSEAPPPPRPFPTFMLGFKEDADRDGIVAQIDAFPTIRNVKTLGTWGLLVDFDHDNTDEDEARKFLQNLEGIKYVEED